MSTLIFPRMPAAGSEWVLARSVDVRGKDEPAFGRNVMVVRAEWVHEKAGVGRVWVLAEGQEAVVEREMWVMGELVVDV